MVAVSARRTLLPLSLVVGVYTAAHAQAAAPAPSGATAAWTLKMKGDIRWQQVTPAGPLLVSTDGALSGLDIERGRFAHCCTHTGPKTTSHTPARGANSATNSANAGVAGRC